MDVQGARDVRTIERAVKERWPLTEEHRKLAALKLLEIIANKDGKSSKRAITSAARALIAMEAQNQADEHKRQPDRGINLDLTAKELADMSDEQLEQLYARLQGSDRA